MLLYTPTAQTPLRGVVTVHTQEIGKTMTNNEYGYLEMNIEKLLKERGISKNTLCKAMDIPRSNLNRYCRNDFERIDATFLCKLLRFFDCTIEELITYKASDAKN